MRRLGLPTVWALMSGACSVAGAQETARAREISGQVTRILSASEFRLEPKNAVLQRLGDRLLELLKRLADAFGGLFGMGRLGAGSWLVVVLYVVFILAIAWGLVILVRRQRWRVVQPPATAEVLAVEQLPEDVPDSAERLLSLSHQLAATGEWRRAFRAAYLATLLLLSEAGVIRFDPSRTNGEYVREAAGSPEGSAILRPITAEFNRLIYGEGEVGEPDWRDAIAAATSARGIAHQ